VFMDCDLEEEETDEQLMSDEVRFVSFGFALLDLSRVTAL